MYHAHCAITGHFGYPLGGDNIQDTGGFIIHSAMRITVAARHLMPFNITSSGNGRH